MLFNTSYIDQAVATLRAQGHAVHDEDAARSPPLGYAHIDLAGRYAFPSPAAGPRLRPLRDPDTAGT